MLTQEQQDAIFASFETMCGEGNIQKSQEGNWTRFEDTSAMWSNSVWCAQRIDGTFIEVHDSAPMREPDEYPEIGEEMPSEDAEVWCIWPTLESWIASNVDTGA